MFKAAWSSLCRVVVWCRILHSKDFLAHPLLDVIWLNCKQLCLGKNSCLVEIFTRMHEVHEFDQHTEVERLFLMEYKWHVNEGPKLWRRVLVEFLAISCKPSGIFGPESSYFEWNWYEVLYCLMCGVCAYSAHNVTHNFTTSNSGHFCQYLNSPFAD